MITVTHKWATPAEVRKLVMQMEQPKERRHKYWLRNNCCYQNLEIDAKGNVRNKEKWFQDACHARLKTDREKHNFAILHFNYRPVVETDTGYSGMDIADILLYIDWMANESPFAGIFLSKNPSEIYEYGALIDTKAHYGLAFAAAIASRTYYEHGREFVSWLHMVKAGIDKNVAYVVALAYKAYTADGKPEFAASAEELYISSSMVNHGGVDSLGWSKKDVERWMRAAPRDKTKDQRAADATFREDGGRYLSDMMDGCEANGAIGGRFGGGGNKKYKVDVFIAYVKEKIEPVLLEMAKEKKAVVVKAPHNGEEPEVDL